MPTTSTQSTVLTFRRLVLSTRPLPALVLSCGLWACSGENDSPQKDDASSGGGSASGGATGLNSGSGGSDANSSGGSGPNSGGTSSGGASSGGTDGGGSSSGGTSSGGTSSGGTDSGGSSSGGTSSNPFTGATLFVDNTFASCSSSSAAGQEICNTPVGDWIGDWSGDVTTAVAGSINRGGSQLRVLIAYNIFNRDCGNHSAGGASSPAAYRTWIDGFANGIGNSKVVVILEPDALAQGCGANNPGDDTLSLLNYAVGKLTAQPNAFVYIDAGNPDWLTTGEAASRLQTVGIEQATGFALNVSNYYSTEINTTYGKEISAQVGNKPFIIDTSRNALGNPDNEWCNPRPRGLGRKSTADTGDSAVHAHYWVKRPGESDGECNGGPSAGAWYEDYAQHLYDNRSF